MDEKTTMIAETNNDISDKYINLEIIKLEKRIVRYFFDNRINNKRDFGIFKNLITDINYINMSSSPDKRFDKLSDLIKDYCSDEIVYN